MRLKSVVLPAPFGPISAVRAPTGTSKRMSCVTASPPKRLVTPSNASAGSAATHATHNEQPARRQAAEEGVRDDTFRTQHHHDDDHDAENQVAGRSADTKQLREHREEDCSRQWPPSRLRAADQHVKQDVDRE